jgi:hypothetical protein
LDLLAADGLIEALGEGQMNLNLQDYAEQPRLTDGAWGTQLERRGLSSGMAPDLWNIENPEAVEELARRYVEAGSEVILTNTFGTNRYILERQRASDRVEELAESGLAISLRATGDKAKVFASIGPTGKIVMMQEISRDDFSAAYVEAARAISRAGPDAIVLEAGREGMLRPARDRIHELCGRSERNGHHDGNLAGRFGSIGRRARRGRGGRKLRDRPRYLWSRCLRRWPS